VELQQEGGRWEDNVLKGVDDAYLENVGYEISLRADGYETAGEAWQAVQEHPGYAIIDRYAVPSRTTTTIIIGGPEFKLDGVYLEDEAMPPIRLRVRDPNTEAIFEVTVIGVGDNLGFGLITSQATLAQSLPFEAVPTTHFIRLGEGADPEKAGAALESVFLKHGLQSIDQVEEVKIQQNAQRVVEQLLLGFLTLGLVVGVAALGVISTRAVVERRQQIGMLRALGFQPAMVAWSFLIESSFVALLGIGLGASLALIPAYQMISDLSTEVPGLHFQVPWDTILFVSGLAYGMALLTTWLPALQASRVTPAEALRYE
jgi:putative ABC transport system permease protein